MGGEEEDRKREQGDYLCGSSAGFINYHYSLLPIVSKSQLDIDLCLSEIDSNYTFEKS